MLINKIIYFINGILNKARTELKRFRTFSTFQSLIMFSKIYNVFFFEKYTKGNGINIFKKMLKQTTRIFIDWSIKNFGNLPACPFHGPNLGDQSVISIAMYKTFCNSLSIYNYWFMFYIQNRNIHVKYSWVLEGYAFCQDNISYSYLRCF